jgi:hypothetical protein
MNETSQAGHREKGDAVCVSLGLLDALSSTPAEPSVECVGAVPVCAASSRTSSGRRVDGAVAGIIAAPWNLNPGHVGIGALSVAKNLHPAGTSGAQP